MQKKLEMIDPRKIKVRDGWNPRTNFKNINDLKNSIIENGVQVPLRVIKEDEKTYLIDGERRLRATMKAIEEGNNIKLVPCIFESKKMTEVDALVLALITNDGEKLNALEEAEAYHRFINWGYAASKIATMVGKSKVYVYERLSLRRSSPEIRKALGAGEISIRDASKIAKKNKTIKKQSEAVAKLRSKKKQRKCCQICSIEGCDGLRLIDENLFDNRKDYCSKFTYNE